LYKIDFPYIEFPQSIKGFWENLSPIVDGVETVKKLIASSKYDPYILTAPSTRNPLSYTEKRIWIEKYFGYDFTKKLILCPNKGLIKGDILIDDNINGRGQENFEGLIIQFGSTEFPDWNSIHNMLFNEEWQKQHTAEWNVAKEWQPLRCLTPFIEQYMHNGEYLTGHKKSTQRCWLNIRRGLERCLNNDEERQRCIDWCIKTGQHQRKIWKEILEDKKHERIAQVFATDCFFDLPKDQLNWWENHVQNHPFATLFAWDEYQTLMKIRNTKEK
jgi:hypothetical protein